MAQDKQIGRFTMRESHFEQVREHMQTALTIGKNTGFGKNRALRQRVLQCRTAFDPKQPFASMRSFSFCCRLND